MRPNERLKLPGPAFKGSVSVCAPAGSYRRAGRLRPPALAPQLKRDPLGGSHATPRRSDGNFLFVLSLNGAPRRWGARRDSGAPRPAPPALFCCGAPPVPSMNRGAVEDSGQGRVRGQPRSPFERRGAPRRVSVQSSPSNTRLSWRAFRS